MALWSLLASVLFVSGAAAAAAPMPTVTLSRAQAANFNVALDAIVTQADVAIVAEGIPLHPTLDVKDVPAIAGQPAPVGEAVDAVAAAYDYDARMDGPVYALEKRYTDPTDLPSLTLGEWTACLQQVLRLTASFDPRIKDAVPSSGGRDAVIGDLAASFTAGELAALRSRRGLSLQNLTPAQEALARRFALYLYVQQRLRSVTDAASSLRMGQADAVFLYADVQGQKHIFGCDIGRVPPGWPPHFAPLGGQACGRGLISLRVISQTPPGVDDPSDPGPAMGRASFAPEHTLAGLMALLNAALIEPGISLGPGLATKAITVAGVSNARARDIALAIADIYGLSVRTTGQGAHAVLHLGLPSSPPPPHLASELPAALDAVIPAPLLRALHARDCIETGEQTHAACCLTYRRGPPAGQYATALSGKAPWKDETIPEVQQAMADRRLSLDSAGVSSRSQFVAQRVGWLPGVLRLAALKRLRALLEPRVDTAPDGRMPFSALNGQERDAFAFVVGAECLLSIEQWACWGAPDWISGFGHSTLVGGLYPQPGGRPPIITLFFATTWPDGRATPGGGGITGVRYVK